eukprot:gene12372-biopygen8145
MRRAAARRAVRRGERRVRVVRVERVLRPRTRPRRRGAGAAHLGDGNRSEFCVNECGIRVIVLGPVQRNVKQRKGEMVCGGRKGKGVGVQLAYSIKGMGMDGKWTSAVSRKVPGRCATTAPTAASGTRRTGQPCAAAATHRADWGCPYPYATKGGACELDATACAGAGAADGGCVVCDRRSGVGAGDPDTVEWFIWGLHATECCCVVLWCRWRHRISTLLLCNHLRHRNVPGRRGV